AARAQRDLDGVRAVADADGMRSADPVREAALEAFDDGTQDESAAREHLGHRRLGLGANRLPLRAQGDEGDGAHAYSFRGRTLTHVLVGWSLLTRDPIARIAVTYAAAPRLRAARRACACRHGNGCRR